MIAGPGDDFVDASGDGRDVIRCGEGNDEVVADDDDKVSASCEVVERVA